MRHKYIYRIGVLLCSLLALVACTEGIESMKDEEICITSLNVGFENTLSGGTRAVDSEGYEGFLKRKLVIGDVVSIYKDDEETASCTALKTEEGWTVTPALTLIRGRNTKVSFKYSDDKFGCDAHAIARYGPSGWNNDDSDCWGNVQSTDNSLKVVLWYSKALVKVGSINSEIGTPKSIKIKTDKKSYSSITGSETLLVESLVDAGETVTGFEVTIEGDAGYTDYMVCVPLQPENFTLEANKQYVFHITLLLPGYYRAWIETVSEIGAPDAWTDLTHVHGNYNKISNEEELRALANSSREKLAGTYVLTSDISLSQAWEPIGKESEPFTGKFYGNGFVISGLNIGYAGANENDIDWYAECDYAGLFGYVEGAFIKGVHVDGVKIFVKGIAAGAIAGKAVNTTFEQCSSSPVNPPDDMEYDITENEANAVLVHGKDNETDVYAGGLVGLLGDEENSTNSSELVQCWNTYTHVRAVGNSQNTHSGGLIGRSNYGGMVACCSYQAWAWAQSETGKPDAGGLIGSSISDARNPILAYGCCAREKYSVCISETGGHNAGDLIGTAKAEVEGANTAVGVIASCWAWKNKKHDDEENLYHEFLGNYDDSNVALDRESCVAHDSPFNDFLKLLKYSEVEFNGQKWEAKEIWMLHTNENGHYTFPSIDFKYNM